MIIRAYHHDDRSKVNKLYNDWNLPKETIDYISESGFVVVKNGHIKGAAFLYTTNSPISMIDCFVVDRYEEKKSKDEIIDGLIETMVDRARKQGSKAIIAEPRFVKSFQRLKKHGFSEFKTGRFWRGF